jgi:transcriptional regulator with XRE-family HTH domain
VGTSAVHPASTGWTKATLSETLPQLITHRGLTLRKLAAAAEVDPAHLSRVMSARSKKRASRDLARRVALALDLPHDFFPEYREGAVVERVQTDPMLRDEIYRRANAG